MGRGRDSTGRVISCQESRPRGRNYEGWTSYGFLASTCYGVVCYFQMDEIATKRTVAVGDCLLWTGCVNREGYGVYYFKDRGSKRAHRAVWEMLVGLIPEGYDLHHTCPNKHCVSPEHLTPMKHGVHQATHVENIAIARKASNAAKLARTHCERGHPFSGDNLGIAMGNRICLTCRRARQKAFQRTYRAQRRAQLL